MQTDTSPLPQTEDDIEPPRPRLSPWRVCIALLVVTVALSGTVVRIRSSVDNAGTVAPPWFAPYVDTTLTPSYAFQDHNLNPSKDTVLSFVVSDPSNGCTPSWGGVDTLDAASTALDLDRRITELRSNGGDVIASFGGRNGTELAVACADVSTLASAYTQVIDRYHLNTIDLDIEGTALDDSASVRRRAQALATVQRNVRTSGRPLAVWLTLPVASGGMNANALKVVDAVLGAGVDLAGVNLMTMDFGGGAGGNMLGTVEQALNAAHDQISAAYAHARVGLNSKHVWNHMGVTVMIGQNDIAGERFNVADAQALVTFANGQGMARLSEWSLNRDTQCGADFAQIGVLSNTCSGVAQERPLQFTEVFGQVSGDAAVAAGVVTTPDPLTTPAPAVTQDDPATSPYPIWRPQGMYRAGYKVVWRGEVYVAKWYSQNFAPDTPGQLSWQTPWQLVGPVLPGDRPLSIPTQPAGTYPAWTSTGSYPQGTKVLYQGLPYQARYFTSGSTPDEYQTDSSESAWIPLFQLPGEPY